MPQEANKEMVIVKLMGGLGNQMFQYAAGRALALKNNCQLKLDLSFLQDHENKPKDYVFRDYDLDIFNLPVSIASIEEVKRFTKRSLNRNVNRVLNKILGPKSSYFKQPHFHFVESFFTRTPPLYLDGYWQSEKFFTPFESAIRQDFSFRDPIPESSALLAHAILHSNAVCVNVRRGDFVVNKMHGTVGIDYYKNADQLIRSKITGPSFYVFSDDVEWCSQNLQFYSPVKFISHSHAGRKFGTYLQLMSLCKHFIIPNSTFGWWAAWLNTNPDKIVFAPKKWFGAGDQDTKDIIPGDWYRL